MIEKLNIETCTTAAESPFRKHHNLLVAEAMERGWEKWARNSTCLAISAKNALQNH